MLFGKNIDVESYLLFLISVFVQAHALRRYWSLCAFAPAQSPVRSPFTRRERMERKGEASSELRRSERHFDGRLPDANSRYLRLLLR